MPARRSTLTLIAFAAALFAAGLPAKAPAAETLAILGANTVGQPLAFVNAESGESLGDVNLSLAPLESALDIDVRPVDGKLYLLVADRTGADTLQLRTVAPGELPAPVGPAVASPIENGYFTIDFDPGTDELRFVSTGPAPRSFRMNPTTGAILGEDTALAFAPGDPAPGAPNVFGLAYDRNLAGAADRTAYVIDVEAGANLFRLMRLGGIAGTPSAASGLLTTAAPITPTPPVTNGIPVSAALDISSAGRAYGALELMQSTFSYQYVVQLDLAAGTYRTIPAGALGFGPNRVAAMPTATVTIDAAGVSTPEGTPATLTFTRSGALTANVSVDYATADGSAVAGTDFATAGGTLTFAPGETSKTIALPTVQDTASEGRESFSVSLRGVGTRDHGVLLTRAVATVVIEDDDGAPAPPGPAARDVRAPAVTIGGLPRTLRRAKLLKGLTVSLTPSEPASLQLTLEASTKSATAASYELVLARASLKLGAGRRSVRLKPRAKLFGRPRRTVKLRLSVVATDASGNRRTVTRTISVTRDRRR